MKHGITGVFIRVASLVHGSENEWSLLEQRISRIVMRSFQHRLSSNTRKIAGGKFSVPPSLEPDSLSNESMQREQERYFVMTPGVEREHRPNSSARTGDEKEEKKRGVLTPPAPYWRPPCGKLNQLPRS